jgi:hypothetical protein
MHETFSVGERACGFPKGSNRVALDRQECGGGRSDVAYGLEHARERRTHFAAKYANDAKSNADTRPGNPGAGQ